MGLAIFDTPHSKSMRMWIDRQNENTEITPHTKPPMHEGVKENECGKFEVFHRSHMVACVEDEKSAWDIYNKAWERTNGTIHKAGSVLHLDKI